MRNSLFLLAKLAVRDIAIRYKGSAAGYFWAFISPLLLLVVYSFVFGYVFKARWMGADTSKTFFALNLFAGMIVHGCMAETIIRASTVYQNNSNYVKRIVFPLWVLPVIPLATALFHAVISFIVLVMAYIVIEQNLHWQVLLLPLLMLPFIMVLLGLAWLLASVGLFVKDLSQILPLVTTILLFMSPVFYPASALPEEIRPLMYLNPLTPSIEVVRNVLFEGCLPSLIAYLVSLLCGGLVAAFGFCVFYRLRVGFSDLL